MARTPAQQKNRDIADFVLKQNERVHELLSRTGFITHVNPSADVTEVLRILKNIDMAVNGNDMGDGDVILSPRWIG